jgi:alanine racemase
MLDVTDVPDVALGNVATFIGSQGETTITAEEYAAVMGSIALEATTALTARVPRCYRAAAMSSAPGGREDTPASACK